MKPTRQSGHPSAFTLLEVLLAVAIFAGAIVVVLSMLPGLTRQGSAAIGASEAQGLPDALTVELQRLAQGNLDALAARIPVMAAPLRDGLPLVAARSGTRVASLDYRAPGATDQIAEAEQYYRVECWRFAEEPLRFDATKHVLALYVRVSWPYLGPGGAGRPAITTEERDRRELTFTVSLRR